MKSGWILLLVLLTAEGNRSQPTKCSTPNSLEGECIFINDCPSILALQDSSNLTTKDVIFLRRSQCDYDGLVPRVCCPVSTRNRAFHIPDKPLPLPKDEELEEELSSRFKPDQGLPDLKDCGRDTIGNRIFNGEFMSIDEFPWMTLLEYNMKQSNGHGFACGGALITKQHVLTAAHCVFGRNEQLLGGLKSVRLGEYDINTPIDCDAVYPTDCNSEPIDLKVEKSFVHPKYDEDSMDQMNDIAILKLEKPIEFTDFIRPICLSKALPPDIHSPGHLQFVAGWGQTETGRTSNVKKKLKVPVVDEPSCMKKYTPFRIHIGPRQLCAGGERDKDSCAGDSGGPLMVQAISPTKGAKWYMTGVVSIGPTPCASNRIPGIYTKVYDYMDWILENIKKN